MFFEYLCWLSQDFQGPFWRFFLSFIWFALDRLKKINASSLILASEHFPFFNVSLYQSSVSLIVWGPGLLSTPSGTSKLLFMNEAFCWMWSIRSMTCNTSKTFLCFCNLTQSRTKRVIFYPPSPPRWWLPPLPIHNWAGEEAEAAAQRVQREDTEERELSTEGPWRPPRRHQVPFWWTGHQNWTSLSRHDTAPESSPFQLK